MTASSSQSHHSDGGNASGGSGTGAGAGAGDASASASTSSSHPPRRRILGGKKHRHAASAAAAAPPPPIREEYEKMWKGTVVRDHRSEGGGGDDEGAGGEGVKGLDDSFVRGLWGSEGAPTGLSTLDIDADAEDGAAAEGADSNGEALPALATPVWKRRAGLGGKLAVAARKEWERRRLELVGTALRYYCIEMDDEEESSTIASLAEDESEEAPSENGASVLASTQAPPSTPSSTRSTPLTPSSRKKPPPPTSSPSWRPHVSFGGNSQHDPSTPRGMLDLSREEFAVEISVEDADDKKAHLPTPYVIRVLRHGDPHWKICVDSRDTLDEWVEALRTAMGEERVDFSNNGSGQHHGFQPGDHVIRWEVMVIPVAYPIQIHGIVLEAGKNCVIIADFGLTSYGKKEKEGESDMSYDVSTSNEEKEHHSVVMDHWKKLRPNQLQRLNVIAYTDEKEIRKWKKVNYGEGSDATPKAGRKKKLGKKMSSLFRVKSGGEGDPASKTTTRPAFSNQNSAGSTNVSREGAQIDDRIPDTEEEGSFSGVSHEQKSNGTTNGSITMSDTPRDMQASASGKSTPANEPAWFGGQNSEISKPGVFSLDAPETEEQPSAEKKSDKDTPKLPKSDPAKIVLARTNFLLEHGDDVLPPYHVFQSNSECIAVWCKTGRWSTLQATIFLGSCLVGNTKTATVMTMGVAAAHAVLLPVAAVGGIAAATAPWIILKKSKEKWEQITISLTEKFWAWAPPEVYVEAIQHWSNL